MNTYLKNGCLNYEYVRDQRAGDEKSIRNKNTANDSVKNDSIKDSCLVNNCLVDQSHHSIEVMQWQQNNIQQRDDEVAAEIPVALSYNGISHAVMMATPQDLKDFAVGFSLSEGIANKVEQLYDINIINHLQGREVAITLASQCFASLKQRHRQLVGRTGCGICGVDSLDQAIRQVKLLDSQPLPTHDAIQASLVSLTQHQHLRTITGAVHAAAWCDHTGQIQLVREDVGRHNALDKLLGALAKSVIDTTTGFVLISSRASYEMIQKACELGINTLIATSAPTSLAVRQAKYAGMNLIAFARNNRHVIYNQAYK